MQVAFIVGVIVASAVSTQAGQCSTNWSQCNGQNWPHGVCCEDPNFECNRKNEYLSLCEPKKTPAPCKDAEESEGCTNVSVEGDATFCVSGEICGDKGWSCPKKGAWASRDCVRNARSYVEAGKCVAPEDATCRKLKTGAWGCVWSSQDPKKDLQVDVWQQCGGVDYRGDKSCSTGNICVKINEYYSQCQPDATQPGLPTWAQCGGHGYNGETECRKEDKCKAWNSYYSQCVPRNN